MTVPLILSDFIIRACRIDSDELAEAEILAGAWTSQELLQFAGTDDPTGRTWPVIALALVLKGEGEIECPT